MTLSGANTYTGTTTVNAGTLALSGSLNVGAGTATTVVASGATLSGAGVITAATLSDSGLGTLSLTGNNAVGAVTTTGTVGDYSFNNASALSLGAITSGGALQVTTGSGTLTLNGNLLAGTGIRLGGGTTGATGLAQSADTAGDVVSLNASGLTAVFGDKHVGVGLAVTSVTAANKVYDAATKVFDATVGATISGGAVSALGSDALVLNISGVTGAFNNKNVGEGKTVTVDGFSLSGTDAGNYNVVQPTGQPRPSRLLSGVACRRVVLRVESSVVLAELARCPTQFAARKFVQREESNVATKTSMTTLALQRSSAEWP